MLKPVPFRRHLLALSLPVLGLSACAPLGPRQDMISPEELRQQAAETQVTALQNRVTQLESDNSRALEDLRQLRGEFERLRFDLDTQQKRSRESVLDLDRRLDRVEARNRNERPLATAAVVPPAPAAPTVLPPVLPVPPTPAVVPPLLPDANKATGAEALRPNSFILPPAPEAPAVSAPSVSLPSVNKPATSDSNESSQAEEASYLQSLDAFGAGKYDEAIRGFRVQLERYPRGSYAENGWYWLGESYYLKRELKQAQAAYAVVIERFTTSKKLPDALYKRGLCQFELGQTEIAKTTWQRLVKDFPNSTPAANARKRLK